MKVDIRKEPGREAIPKVIKIKASINPKKPPEESSSNPNSLESYKQLLKKNCYKNEK